MPGGAGKRLGSGAIELSVERGAKERLTALHDGFLPSTFTLDGSRDAVTVRLKRVPTPELSATSESGSPVESGVRATTATVTEERQQAE